MNKFEQVTSDHHQMSLAEGGYIQRWGGGLGCGHVQRGGDGSLGGMSRGGAWGEVSQGVGPEGVCPGGVGGKPLP